MNSESIEQLELEKNLARLAAILAILLFFSARGPKINNIEKQV